MTRKVTMASNYKCTKCKAQWTDVCDGWCCCDHPCPFCGSDKTVEKKAKEEKKEKANKK